MDSNTTDQLQHGVIFQQYNVPIGKAHHTNQKIAEMDWKVLTHLLYSSDLAPSDFHLFGPLNKSLRGGIKFEYNDAVQQHVLKFLAVEAEDFYAAGFTRLVKRTIGGDSRTAGAARAAP